MITAAESILRAHRPRLFELLPWVIAIAVFYLLPGYRGTTTQLLVFILFALSVDLIVGYAGIVSLGHAAFYGIGAYAAALLAKYGWTEPVSALFVAAAIAGAVAFVSGWILLRTEGLTLLMLTMAVAIMMHELATELDDVTGGFDGINFTPGPILGLFEFDVIYYSTNYLYALAVLFILFMVMRTIVYAPFGRALIGIRENPRRMAAIGSPVHFRQVTVYVISAMMAGVAGAVFAQVQANVTPGVFAFEWSGEVLIMVILGGLGRLYGAFIGATAFIILRDFTEQLLGSALPWWMLTIGIVLIVVVLFARRGLLGIGEDVTKLIGGRRA